MIDQQLSPDTLRFILHTVKDIALEHDIEGLCKSLLNAAIELTQSEGGTLYLASGEETQKTLQHTLFINTKLGINNNAFTEHGLFSDIKLYDCDLKAEKSRVAGFCFHENQLVNIPDIQNYADHAFSGPREFDETHGYNTKSILCCPINNNKQKKPLGVFQLINATDHRGNPHSFSRDHESALSIFAEFAASAIERQLIIDRQRNLLVDLSGETSTDALLERILREAKSIANADAGTLYLLNDDADGESLSFTLLVNDTLGIDSTEPLQSTPSQRVPMHHSDGSNNLSHLASASAHQKKAISVTNAYTSERFDFSGTKAFDAQFSYRSESFLVIPLLNHDDEVIGVLQLINALNPTTLLPTRFSNRSIQLIKALARYAAIGLNNQLLVAELKNLLDAFIKCIAQAIDAKSPHTSAHCQRIPLLTEMIAQAACEDQGVFREFSLDDDEWYELNVAAWLHDCGKLATPDTLLDKSTKLHLLGDQIESVKARFSCLIQEAELLHVKQAHQAPEKSADLLIAHNNKVSEYRSALKFLIECNKGSEFMAPAKQERIAEIAKLEWTNAQGEKAPILTESEVSNLSIQKGTLNPEERQAINDHMVVTVDMLESLPFPKKLRRVPEYAAGHHERMDGTGFPKGLTRDQLSIPARMMAIADVFEALTASDRPYKEPMKVSKALDIMNGMTLNQHLDHEIFQLFVQSRVWETYADEVLKPEQLDLSDPPPYFNKTKA